MAINHYLNLHKNQTEQNLIENLTIEAIKFYGMDLQYLPRNTGRIQAELNLQQLLW